MAVHRAAPDGTERLYVNGRFNTDPGYAETYGQDLDTGRHPHGHRYRAKPPTAAPSSTHRRTARPTRLPIPSTRCC